MKRKPSVLSLMSATLLGAVLVASSCKKEVEGPGTDDRALSATIIIPSNPTLSGVLGTGHNVRDSIRLTSTVSWRLNGLVYVDSADVLIVDAGTTIRGNLSTGTGIPGGGLVVCRGAKILAQGTATSPIVFTSAATTPQSGDWAGVILLGNASSNHTGRVQIEGVPSNPPASATFGGTVGTNDADNSGILRNVRIEYAGFELTPNNEINGLTFGGVGSGTVVDFVEVFKSRDDAFEWFGGTVNASHLIAVDPLDDMFDADNGYRGTVRFALGLADTTRADVSQSNGFEVDNNSGGTTATPLTNPQFRKVTIIGLPNQAKAISTNRPPSGTGRYGRAAQLRRNTNFDIDSSIFMGFNFGLSLDSTLGTTPAKYRAAHATWLTRTFTQAYFSGGTPTTIAAYITEGTGSTPATGAGFAIAAPGSFLNYAIADGNLAYRTPNPNTNLLLANPFNRSSAANFIPLAASPARQHGAFPAGSNWVSGTWARFQ
jgi:hypothetical protein